MIGFSMSKSIELLWIANFLEHIMRLRDPYENNHGNVVAYLSTTVGILSKFSDTEMELLSLGSRLHDVGKLLIPEHILNKPARLTLQEWEMIYAHPKHGVELLRIVKPPPEISEIICNHHENLDGTGYYGTKAEKISNFARIVRVCDSFDALTRSRPYKVAMTDSDAISEMSRHIGTRYDPFYFESLQKIVVSGDHKNTGFYNG